MNDHRPLLFRNRRLIPAMLFSAGIGVAGYYGMSWYQAPKLSPTEIEQSTELNLALDLAQMSADQRPQGKDLEDLKARVRAEVQSDVDRDRKTLQERFAAGLVAMVFAFGQLVFVSMSERARKAK